MSRFLFTTSVLISLLLPVQAFAIAEEARIVNEPVLIENSQYSEPIFSTDYRKRPFSVTASIVNQGLPYADFLDCRETIKQGLQLLPEVHVQAINTIYLHNDASKRRGLANTDTIYLRCGLTQHEQIAVLIHEVGHIVDLGYLTTTSGIDTGFGLSSFPVYKNDPSLDFYQLSWASCQAYLPQQQTQQYYASGYGMSNCFEDFAESYALFVLHNDVFVAAAEKNSVLADKYSFMAEVAFAGLENYTFSLISQSRYKTDLTKQYKRNILAEQYDITKLGYKL